MRSKADETLVTFVLNSYVLSLEMFVDASYVTVVYVPTPHRSFSGFYDVIRTEKSCSFLRSSTCVRQ